MKNGNLESIPSQEENNDSGTDSAAMRLSEEVFVIAPNNFREHCKTGNSKGGNDLERYCKEVEKWHPENYAGKLAGAIVQHGLDEKTMNSLRARNDQDLDQVLDHLNKSQELKSAGISLNRSEDGQSIILSVNGKEQQREFVSGRSGWVEINPYEKAPWSDFEERRYTPELDRQVQQAAESIAKEISEGGMSSCAIELLRNQDLSGLFDLDNDRAYPGLLERVNRLLRDQGLKLDIRFQRLNRKPEDPYTVRFPEEFGTTSSAVHIDLLKANGERQSSVYWGWRNESYRLNPRGIRYQQGYFLPSPRK